MTQHLHAGWGIEGCVPQENWWKQSINKYFPALFSRFQICRQIPTVGPHLICSICLFWPIPKHFDCFNFKTLVYSPLTFTPLFLHYSWHHGSPIILSRTVYSVCEVGTVGKISDCQPEGPGFNPRPGRGLNSGWPSFATPSVDRDVKPLVWFSRRSIGGLKRTHTLVDKSRLMPILWSVTSSSIYSCY